MKQIALLALCLAGILQIRAFAERPNQSAVTRNLLPIPQAVNVEGGSLVLNQETSISLDGASGPVGKYFAQRLRRGTGWAVPEKDKGTIRFEAANNVRFSSPEAYILQITPGEVRLRAATPAGFARGAETLLQLMPPFVYGKNVCEKITLPALSITDAPKFPWRGVMVDVSRTFQDKNTILKLLDGVAASKINIFHWHLTDDQGWRLPIEGYPKLTAKGPAYSREDIRQIVAHAEELGITIVPEVDMPGHSSASCLAYPEIATNGRGTMNPGAEASYKFIEAVMKDVAAQFLDSPYVHIGADEVGAGGWKTDAQCKALMQREKLKSTHELYLYFINRAVAIARSHGKRCIAWDEALDAKCDPTLIIMSWHGMPPGINAAKAGRDVIFCPNPSLYVNHANTRSKKNPRAYSAHPAYLNQIYFVDCDTPAIPQSNRARVMGGEICLWGECVTNSQYMFTHIFPRVSAIGENLWQPREKLDWGSFIERVKIQNQRLEAMGIGYFWKVPETLAMNIGSWKSGELGARKGVIEISLEGKLRQAGEQEFLIAQGTGEGRFRVSAVELIKDGVVVDTDRHATDSSVYRNVDSIYIVTNPDTTGKYALRIHAKTLSGDCGGIVQHIPPLAREDYSRQCAPGSGANRSKQDR